GLDRRFRRLRRPALPACEPRRVPCAASPLERAFAAHARRSTSDRARQTRPAGHAGPVARTAAARGPARPEVGLADLPRPDLPEGRAAAGRLAARRAVVRVYDRIVR